MLTLRVKVFATLARERTDLRAGGPVAVAVPAGADLAGVVAALDLPAERVQHIFVNGRRRPLDFRPAEGDEVAIFPPLAGG